MPTEKTMRDVLLEHIYKRICDGDEIFFVSADFGAPALDRIRDEFPDRFINVGIAEQNLISVASGLALEGFTVYAYAIASFLTIRAFEQIRINISLNSHIREMDINLIGVGAGLSYDVSGPTHHCLEDLALMRLLPGLQVYSPSDWYLTNQIMDAVKTLKSPKYFRLDAKPLAVVKERKTEVSMECGFSVIDEGKSVCIISTGYMTHRALKAKEILHKRGCNVGLIDLFRLKPVDDKSLVTEIKKYKHVVSIEEGFIGKGGMDSLLLGIINKHNLAVRVRTLGFDDEYIFEMGGRDYLHQLCRIDENSIVKVIEEFKS